MSLLENRSEDAAAARLAASVTSYALGVSTDSFWDLCRGSANEALARQVAMYLCHVTFEISLARVAMAFGRDRSTVAYACHAVEDRRENHDFERWITGLEVMLRETPPPAWGQTFAEPRP